MTKGIPLTLICLFYLTGTLVAQKNAMTYSHPIPFDPSTYVCYRTVNPIEVDGAIDEDAWENAPWTDYFVDIEGELKPTPTYTTRAKMLWDDEYFYFAAEMEEPHLWATLTERDAIVYYDDDFEIFIDPDGDGQNYYEFEVNAHNAVWDLLLLRPYRVKEDDPVYLMNWDIKGIKSAVQLNGTLNDPSDEDSGWMVEVAMPWSALQEFAPERRMPEPGEQWRVNFSRVDWPLEVVDGKYKKKISPTTKDVKQWKVQNWVWSPSGRVDMHQTETWGYVQFADVLAGKEKVAFETKDQEKIKWALWQLYFQQKKFWNKNKSYSNDPDHFTIPRVDIKGYDFQPQFYVTKTMFEITAPALAPASGYWSINDQGRIWKTK